MKPDDWPDDLTEILKFVLDVFLIAFSCAIILGAVWMLPIRMAIALFIAVTILIYYAMEIKR